MKPLFIVIDGIDGTGKSTQVTLLSSWLREIGIYAEITREPGGTDAGALIRSILTNKDMLLSPDTELLLFCADRAEHQKRVDSMLANGVTVVCDRFLSSTWAYQIFGRKLQPALLEAVIPLTVRTFPDLTVILDMDTGTALKRAEKRLSQEGKSITEGRFETEKKEFFLDVQKGFHWYASRKEFGKSVIADASGTIEETADKIRKLCIENLKI